MADVVEALQRVPILAGLDRGALAELGGAFREHRFEAGSTLIREGERGSRVLSFFLILEGEAEVSADGRRVATLGPGAHIGEVALIADVPRTATVTALTALRCLASSAWEFRRLVEAQPDVAAQLAGIMTERMRELGRDVPG